MATERPGFRIDYGRVEAALVRMHAIDTDGVLALRARFGALQRGGLLGARPGKGSKLDYGPDQLHRVVLAFELTQLGIAPSIVLRLISERWDRDLSDIFVKAEDALVHERPDVILILAGVTLGFGDQPMPTVSHMTMDKLMRRLTLALDGERLPARMSLVNLTAQLRKFHTALAYYHLLPVAMVAAALEPKSKRSAARKSG